MVETIHHIRVGAEVEQLEEVTLKEFIKENKNNINLMALDDVTDPRNIGSIIRRQ